MTKQEFQKRIGAEISQKDYSIVEHVYTWHPSISEVEGNRTAYRGAGTDGADRVQNGTVQGKTPGVPDVGTD